MRVGRGWTVGPLLACAFAPLMVMAQDAASPPPGPGSAEATTPAELDRVIVTARRREEAILDVPIAVTVLDGNELQSRAAQDLGALGAATPNLTIYNARAFNSTLTATIRGVGQYDPVWGIEPGVALYIDDVYLARPQAALLDILDVERIEVLRGPQGTLYGKNSIGGAIKYITRPTDPYFSGTVVLTAGDYDRRDGKAIVNVPLGDQLRTRLAVGRYLRDGYGRNLITGKDVSDRDVTSMRATFDWLPAEAVDVRFAFDRYRDRSAVRGARRLFVLSTDPDGTPPDPGRYDVRSDAPNQDDIDADGASATIDWTIDARWRLKSVTAHREGHSAGYIDFDTLPRQISTLARDFRDKQTSQEFQLQWTGGHTQGVAGLYWFDGEAEGVGYGYDFGQFFDTTRGMVGTRSLALYGDLAWDLTARVSAEAGLRYTHEDKRATVVNQEFTDATFLVPNGAVYANFRDATTFEAFSPRLALSYAATDDAMLYAQATRGFKGGTYNIRANTAAVPTSSLPIEDENATSYEIGAKAQWRDGAVTLATALFHTDYRDIQLSVATAIDANGDGVLEFFGDFRNAGAGTMRGAEVEATVQASRYVRLLGHAGYLDTHYDAYFSRGVDMARTQRFPNAPDWTAGASTIGEWPLARGGAFVARLDGQYRSKAYPTTDINDFVLQGGYTLWNASLTWRSPLRGWDIALIGENLSDKGYRTASFYLINGGLATGFYGAPRTFALSMTYSF